MLTVELEPLRRALARMLTTDLAAYAQLRAVARERVGHLLKETNLGEAGLASPETAQRAGRALEADYLVQGTFSATGNRITAHLEVFDVAAGRGIGSAEASGAANDVLQVEATLLKGVAKALGLEKRAALETTGC